MSRLVSSILLSILLFPLAGVVYLVFFFVSPVDLTALKYTRCDECGWEFTVDEILARLPGRAAVELER